MPSTGHRTFHLLPLQQWAEARATSAVVPPSLALEGFVHCTDGWSALIDTANRHYASERGSFLALTIDLAHVGAPWRYDDAQRIYPHVYGPLPIGAVLEVRPMARSADGRFLVDAEVVVNSLEPLLERLSSAGARVAASRQAVADGAPWPVGAQAAGGAEHEWGPTEVLAHVAEMLPYWLGEMERVIAGSDGRGGGGPTAFGRTATDDVRRLSVARDATLPPRELFDRIAAALQRYRWRLPELTPAEIARTGTHPTRGTLSVAELLDRFAVSHLEEHAAQLEHDLPRGG